MIYQAIIYVMLEILILLLALVGLWIGSELIIQGSLNISRHYRISPLFIGLTILAFGTDLPELFIAVTGAAQRLAGIETSGLIIGNAIGSSFSQIGLILGIAALAGVITISKRGLQRDGLMAIAAVVLVFLLGLDGVLSKADGFILIATYLIYLLAIFREERVLEKVGYRRKMELFWAFTSLIAGFAILLYASSITIKQALFISDYFGIAQSYIGILIVGLGTSLPELATSLSAMRRGAPQLAIGNLLGSNIFDLLFTLGLGSAISGFLVSKDFLVFDIPALFVISLLAIVLLFTRKRLHRKEAIALIGIYVFYYLFKIGTLSVGLG